VLSGTHEQTFVIHQVQKLGFIAAHTWCPKPNQTLSIGRARTQLGKCIANIARRSQEVKYGSKAPDKEGTFFQQ
jgi:hypothetical protein